MRAYRFDSTQIALTRVAAAACLLGACAPRGRPPELVALEKLRSDPTLADPDVKAFDLLAAADDLLVRASAEWQRNPEHARRDALMGQIKMKTALAILQVRRAQQRIAELDGELAIAQDEAARLEEQLAIAQEEVALLEQFRRLKVAAAEERKAFSAQVESTKKQAASDRQRFADQLAAQTRRADALDGLRKAELAIRTADTVDAAHFAKAKYEAASTVLREAHKELDAGHWDAVVDRSQLAAREAEAASAAARPQYESAAAALSDRARDRALEVDATALPGIRTRLDRINDLQCLVLALGDLFEEGKAVLAPKSGAVLTAIHDLLVKYPTYAVHVTGYSDARGTSADQLASSLARANAVYWSLVTRGIDPRRMTVDGKGAADPIDDGSGGLSARSKDARVELSILYHVGPQVQRAP